MKIFVTGGTGFIGSHFLRAALSAGHRVVALRRRGSLPRIPLPQEPEWVEAALDEVPQEALSDCDALVHLAAVGVSPQKATWQELFRWNVTASLDLWIRAADAGIRRMVHCGSCMEYGRSAARFERIPADAPLEPVSAYGACKAAASVAAMALAAERGLKLSILRPFTVYGEGQHPSNFLPSLLKAAASGENFKMSPGTQIRDFQPVEACAEDFLLELTVDVPSGIARRRNLGSGQPKTLADFAREQWIKSGARGILEIGALPHRPNEIMRFVPELKINNREPVRA